MFTLLDKVFHFAPPEIPEKATWKSSIADVPEGKDLEDYKRLARKLQLTSAELVPSLLRQVIDEELQGVYDYSKVFRYLTGKLGKTWGWRQVTSDGWRYEWRGTGSILRGPYTKAVPYPVMVSMEKLQWNIPSIQFYISDTRNAADTAPDPDPFLLVSQEYFHGSSTPAGLVGGVVPEAYVVERWDEPSFR